MESYCPKELSFIAKMFVRIKPQEAKEIISIFREQKTNNQDRVAQLYQTFQRTGAKDKRLFICCVLLVNTPAIFQYDYYPLQRGLNKEICQALKQSQPLTTRLIREAITYYKVYPDFKQRANELVKKEVA